MSGALLPQAEAIRPGTLHLAFPVYEQVPSGCCLWPIRDERHLPHFQSGEWAVVDTTDREIALGELYMIRFSNGPAILQVVRAAPMWQRDRRDSDEPLLMLCPLNRPGSREEMERRARAGEVLYSSDGPAYPDYVRKRIIGRVVGLFENTRQAA